MLFFHLKGFCIKLYLVLREYMDGKDQTVSALTWDKLATHMELEKPLPGSHDKGGKPSLKELRTGIKKLEKFGLVESKSAERNLIFWLKKAPNKQEIKEHRKNLSSGGGAEEGHMRVADQKKPTDLNAQASEWSAPPGMKGIQKSMSRGNHSIDQLLTDTNINKHNSLPLDTLSEFENSESDAEAAFKIFWTEYPRKDAKKKAREIFIARKLHLQLDAILLDLRRRSWTGDTFTPLPNSYLNQERWNDESRGETKRAVSALPRHSGAPKSAIQRAADYWDLLTGKSEEENDIDVRREIEINPQDRSHS